MGISVTGEQVEAANQQKASADFIANRMELLWAEAYGDNPAIKMRPQSRKALTEESQAVRDQLEAYSIDYDDLLRQGRKAAAKGWVR